jgi:ribosome-binding protein aMBF1 (putative translation factor)
LTQRSGLIPVSGKGVDERNAQEDWGAKQLNQGERVRKYRRQKGLSQEQLGAMIGFSQSKISKIERGDWDSLSDLRLIARVLGVPIEELVREEAESSDAK